MERTRTRSIQGFILDHVDGDPRGIARRVAQAYGISRQAANRHLDALVQTGLLDEAGHTRARSYALRRTSAVSREFRVTPVLGAERVWSEHAAPVLAGDRAALRDACRAVFKELLENAVAHAGASWITFELATTAREVDLTVSDDGRGVFVSLAEKLRVATPREAVEEFARLARMRSMESPAVKLMLLARGTERFTLASSGVSCEFDAARDLWSVREDEATRAGTSASCRFRRTPAGSAHTRGSRESSGSARTHPPLRPR
ncbi:MAG TPA: hypothetical protein VEC56_03660 [Candidatus Krumholzibacteria bacterium]|nr:hypothetical protein [Candidatus Krumholzibacteria bacterium]